MSYINTEFLKTNTYHGKPEYMIDQDNESSHSEFNEAASKSSVFKQENWVKSRENLLYQAQSHIENNQPRHRYNWNTLKGFENELNWTAKGVDQAKVYEYVTSYICKNVDSNMNYEGLKLCEITNPSLWTKIAQHCATLYQNNKE
jgi:hypothetical protein